MTLDFPSNNGAVNPATILAKALKRGNNDAINAESVSWYINVVMTMIYITSAKEILAEANQ
ncbi:hypothetical protein [Bacillus sp. BP-3]|uniref:hypothetical protein n=1 Tax=Bacillus sp. BP-3 TaxID=3022773 RepID=UPI00232CB847|nr:hypothetical protein [Bacillus sp. BP-3]